jgi:NDP-sugar pyrophosphorylase family protein
MLQEMIDRKVAVQAVPVKHGWLEFDTAEDYEVYLALLENRKLEQFFRF